MSELKANQRERCLSHSLKSSGHTYASVSFVDVFLFKSLGASMQKNVEN